MTKPAVDVSKLSRDEQLTLLEELWECLSRGADALSLTEAQRSELDRRLDDLQREGPSGLPWDEIVRRLQNRSA
jgi:putative addiction module component (TIGR02574 family)